MASAIRQPAKHFGLGVNHGPKEKCQHFCHPHIW
jgi:hypothetical protein